MTTNASISLVSRNMPRPIPVNCRAAWRQRVGIARALATGPEILLLDEPPGALDAMTRLSMQRELERISQEQQVTMIMVTHDIEQAVTLADKILVLGGGHGIRRVIPATLPRPRDRSCHEFGEVRGELLQEFHLSSN